MTRDELNKLLGADKETEHLEFKEISGQISILGKDQSKTDKKSLYGYCAAIGNEGGGKLILGVKDEINPSTGMRDIVGTNAIQNVQKAEEEIYKVLGRKIEIEDVITETGKVQIVHIPSHPTGAPFKFYGVHLMRNGEHLEEMDNGTLVRILNETRSDFSAQINRAASFEDLDPVAIEMLKKKWVEKSKNKDLIILGEQEILEKLLLITKNGITNACILLVGKPESIAKLIPCSEVFLEWRLESKKPEHDSRDMFRGPYILVQDKIWDFVNNRNTRVPFKQGFFEQDIWAYDEGSVREAILNAFAHREYQNRTDPIYIRISPEKISVKSAGGFLPGVNAENALDVEGQWRNRRLMEVLGMIGLVERAGIGLDRIYKATISQGKGLPDFEGTTNEFVVLNIPAKIKDLNFVYYLQKIESEIQMRIDTVKDFIDLEYIREHGKALNKERLTVFLEKGIVEKTGKGRGVKYILTKSFYEFIDNRSEYTRKKWLSKEQQKQVLLNYLDQHKKGQKSDFKKLFEGKTSDHQIYILLDELRKDGKVVFIGEKRSKTGYWNLVDKK
jgi:ATP-dependent DNA helicase RecG